MGSAMTGKIFKLNAQALGEGAIAKKWPTISHCEIRMAVRPNHLGIALQRHLRAQLTNAAARPLLATAPACIRRRPAGRLQLLSRYEKCGLATDCKGWSPVIAGRRVDGL